MTQHSTPFSLMRLNDKDTHTFRQKSSEVGNDLNLVQGAGGNTSVKDGEVLWVKASGFQLKDALKKDIFLPIEIIKAQQHIKAGKGDNLSKCIIDRKAQDGVSLRPSIETALHALMPHKYVFHVHALNTLTASIQKNLTNAMDTVLREFKNIRIKYVRPGIPLAEAVKLEIDKKDIDIIILDNHGLVVGSNNVSNVVDLIREIEIKMGELVSYLPSKSLKHRNKISDTIWKGSGFKPAPDGVMQAPAFVDSVGKNFTRGSLFPDQVVFLGACPVRSFKKITAQSHIKELSKLNPLAKVLIFAQMGVLVKEDFSQSAEEVFDLVVKISSGIPDSGQITVLSLNDELELLGWDAENYRHQIQN